MNILELYSGIGGMHMALKESGIKGQIVAAADINTVANSVYCHNFPSTLILNRNIQSLTSSHINKLNTDAIFMSPPCQPFTRNGLKLDISDPRTCSFSHLLQILPELDVKYILIENVKGFESSFMHDKLVIALKECGFIFQEFILSPTQIGVSNTRHRYYCIAKKTPLQFNFNAGDLMESLPEHSKNSDLFPLSEIVEENIDKNKYLIPDKILVKRAMLLDICNYTSQRSCCFTKAYGKYVEGTGSVFTPKTEEEIDKVYAELQNCISDEATYIECIRKLELRFFTPNEVSRLMSFPDFFSFPEHITMNQKYRLLGNSINVKLVAKLIQLLVKK